MGAELCAVSAVQTMCILVLGRERAQASSASLFAVALVHVPHSEKDVVTIKGYLYNSAKAPICRLEMNTPSLRMKRRNNLKE